MLDRRSLLVALAGGLATPFIRPSHAAALSARQIGSPQRLAPLGVDAVNPVVTAFRAGGYFGAWVGSDSGSFSTRWYARRFGSDGNPIGATSSMDGDWDRADIAPLGDERALAFGMSGRPIVRAISATGAFSGTAKQVTSDAVRYRRGGPIATRLAGGAILLVWASETPTSANKLILGRILAPDLTFKTAVFRINGALGEIGSYPMTVAPLADGGAIVGLASETSKGDKFVFRRISSTGAPVGSAFAPTALAGATDYPVLGAALLHQGNFAIAWAGSTLQGRIYNSSMKVIGSFGPISVPAPEGLITLSVPMTYAAGRIVMMIPSAGLQAVAVPLGGGAPIVAPTALNTTSGNVNDLCVQPGGILVASSHRQGSDGNESFTTRFTIS